MKFFLLALLSFTLSFSAMAGSFNCHNPQQKKWTEYYCIYGDYTTPHKLENIQFGTCEGSSQAGEEEPVNIVEITSINNNTKLAASSNEWRNAYSYDLTTKELGTAVLYIQPETFKSTQYGSIVRLKINENGKIKDLKLTCGAFL